MWLIQVDQFFCSIGWFNWLDQLLGSVVGACGWFMRSIHAVDPNGAIFAWFDWLVRLVGSVGSRG